MAPMSTPTASSSQVPPPEVYAKDAIIGWFRCEFAAANAIIDALCDHVQQIGDGEYAAAFAALHRRRMNWMPVIHMQKFYSVSDVSFHLQCVAEKRRVAIANVKEETKEEGVVEYEEKNLIEVVVEKEEIVEEKEKEESSVESPDQIESPGPGGSTGGSSQSQEEESTVENVETCSDDRVVQICSDHEACANRPERIKTCKGFMAKEPVKGHMINVVKGLKMFEDIFMEPELSKLYEFINDLRAAGRNGELSGETFIFFNKQLKGNKREIIQLGVPIFQPTEETSNIEPIPPMLQNVIDHLVQWRLLPESRQPNSCVINFFDEDEHSQPYYKPPHLDNPISTLFLSETKMAFGRALGSDHDGNYKGSLILPVKEGSLVVMRGNSADMARHVVCPSPNTRICITFLKVRPSKTKLKPSPAQSPPLTATAMTLWQPEGQMPPNTTAMTAGGSLVYAPQTMSPTWPMTTIQAPIMMLAPTPQRPVTINGPTRRNSPNGGGTGVFLPWTVGPKKYIKHLPPRIQKRRLNSLRLPAPLEMQVQNSSQIPCIAV